MVKYKLVDTLLYQSEEGGVEGKFIIGGDALWASRKVVAEIFGTIILIFQCILKILFNMGSLKKIKQV